MLVTLYKPCAYMRSITVCGNTGFHVKFQSKSQNSACIWENLDQKKLHIWTLFTQLIGFYSKCPQIREFTCPSLIIKTWRFSGIFVLNFEHIWHLLLVLLLWLGQLRVWSDGKTFLHPVFSACGLLNRLRSYCQCLKWLTYI